MSLTLIGIASYRNSLENVIDSDINDELTDKYNHPWMSKLSAPALWSRKAVLVLFELLGNNSKTTSSKMNKLRPLAINNLSPKLPPSIILQDLLSPLLKSNDCRLSKTKNSVRLASEGLADLSYSARQSADTLFWGYLAISTNYA